MNRQRRIAWVAQIINARTQQAQRIHQIAYRPLVHARHTRNFVFPAAQRQHRGQHAHRRARIAQEQIRLFDRKRTARSLHAQRTRSCVAHTDTQRAQGRNHVLRILGIQHVADQRFALGQPRQQQSAIGNAF